MIINILSLLLSLLLIYSTFLSFKKNYFNIFEMIGWLLIWFGIIYLSIRPDAIYVYIQNSLNVSFKDTILTLSLLILFILNFRIYLKIKQNEKKVDKIVRSEALKEFFKNNK